MRTVRPISLRRGLHAQGRAAFTLIEALVLLTVFSIVAVGAAVGLQSVVKGPEVVDDALAIDQAIMSQIDLLKRTAATSWSTLSSSAGTTTVTINGKQYSQTITVTPQPSPDGSGGTANDFCKITVLIARQSMVTYVSQP